MQSFGADFMIMSLHAFHLLVPTSQIWHLLMLVIHQRSNWLTEHLWSTSTSIPEQPRLLVNYKDFKFLIVWQKFRNFKNGFRHKSFGSNLLRKMRTFNNTIESLYFWSHAMSYLQEPVLWTRQFLSALHMEWTNSISLDGLIHQRIKHKHLFSSFYHSFHPHALTPSHLLRIRNILYRHHHDIKLIWYPHFE